MGVPENSKLMNQTGGSQSPRSNLVPDLGNNRHRSDQSQYEIAVDKEDFLTDLCMAF